MPLDPVVHRLPAHAESLGNLAHGHTLSYQLHCCCALERPEREREERPQLVIDAMQLREGDVVAEIGAGTGYF